MLSAPVAAELLERAGTVPRLCQIAAELGFGGTPQQLDPELQTRLDLPPDIEDARLVIGDGALRALVVRIGAGSTARDAITRIARALTARAPHCLWLILGTAARAATVFTAAFTPRTGGVCIRTLLVDRHHVFAADAETLAALSASTQGPDMLTHARWLDVLGRDSITRKFYADLAAVVNRLSSSLDARIGPTARDELALLNVSRLLFLAFLQARGWLNGDHAFLQNAFEAGIGSGGRVHARVLEPLFFGTLNTRMARRQPRTRAFGHVPYLNGGLFSRTYVERVHRTARLSDEALGALFSDLLARYRFTPREEAGDWADTAIDPAILGHAFESLMEPGARRESGTFYTPPPIVERATRAALEHALGCDLFVQSDAALPESAGLPEFADLLARVRDIRLLDPTCGSGAFLVHALRELAELRRRLSGETVSEARAAVLATSIYGVDFNPTAVWLCQLRLWLCLAVEYEAASAAEVPPLPNLDRNIRVGDTLASSTGSAEVGRSAGPSLALLRSRYARAHGARKRTLARQLDTLERRSALLAIDLRIDALRERRRELLAAVRSPDLFGRRGGRAADRAEIQRLRLEARSARAERQRLRSGAALPFSFDVQFGDVVGRGGFDAIVGNPPWVRPHRLSPHARAALRNRFAVWRRAQGTRSPAFGAQTDLAAPFVERSLALLRPGGALALLVPAKLWSSIGGAALRRHLLESAVVLGIEDFSESARMFNAAAYPSLLIAARQLSECRSPASSTRVAIHRRASTLSWTTAPALLGVDGDGISPWVLVPPEVRASFDTFRRSGVPLARTAFGPPRLGVKTGCNRAFIVSVRASCQALVEVSSDDARGWVERNLLRPALRGELVHRWSAPRPAEFIVWTHDRADRPMTALPQHAGRWLRQWKRSLMTRTDARASHAWWRLFRTPAARNHSHRVVWCDIGRSPRALVLEPGDPTVPVNTCYVAFAGEQDAYALSALLNSQLAAAWLNVLAEPARGGYRRYMGWTISLLPIPTDRDRFVQLLAPFGRAGASGECVSETSLLEAVIEAYGVKSRDVRSLLEWQDV